MVRRVRLPAGANQWFTGNQLSGWQDGVQYTPDETTSKEHKRKRRLRRLQRMEQAEANRLTSEIMAGQHTPTKVSGGISLL